MTIYIKTPDGEVAVKDIVAERLLAAGHITKDDEGRFVAANRDRLMHVAAEHGVCDFCSEERAPHLIPVPSFVLFDDGHTQNTSTGAWAACDTCHALVQANERAKLLQRAVDHMAHGKFTAAAIAGLHTKFWTAREEIADAAGAAVALADFILDKFPHISATKAPEKQDERRQTIRRLTGLEDDEIDQLMRGDITYKNTAKKLIAFTKKLDKGDIDRQLRQMEQDMRRPMPEGYIPHWQMALDARFKALDTVRRALEIGEPVYRSPEGFNISDPVELKRMMDKLSAQQTIKRMDFQRDAKLLAAAETYSFNEETVGAIFEATNSIPHETPLSSIETPNTGAGWFWFKTPLPLTSAPNASDDTAALLWGWDSMTIDNSKFGEEVVRRTRELATPEQAEYLNSSTVGTYKQIADDIRSRWPDLVKKIDAIGHEVQQTIPRRIEMPVIRFSTYVLADKPLPPFGMILPATKWYWPLGYSYHDMIALSLMTYRDVYGKTGGFKGAGEMGVMGEAGTMKIVAELSLFFLAACMWFKQKVLIAAPGHIERHARKRYVKERKLKEPPSVRVIALRASMREPAEPREPGAEKTARAWQCRWVVKGHARLQPCGPGRADKKLIWIDPYTKGPEDKPLRTREKVYAVIR